MNTNLKSFLDQNIAASVDYFNKNTPAEFALSVKKERARQNGESYLITMMKNAEYLRDKVKVTMDFIIRTIDKHPIKPTQSELEQYYTSALSSVITRISMGNFTISTPYQNLPESAKIKAIEKEYIRWNMSLSILSSIYDLILRDDQFVLWCKDDKYAFKQYLNEHFPLSINDNLIVSFR